MIQKNQGNESHEAQIEQIVQYYIRLKKKEIDDLEFWNVPRHLYPRELEQFYEEQLICSICMLLLREPYEFICQHIFCKGCVIQLNKSSAQHHTLKCPICKTNQARDFESKGEVSLHLKTLKFWLNHSPVVCHICFKLQESQEESKTQTQLWVGSLRDFQRHIYYQHRQPSVSVGSYGCGYSFFGCAYTVGDQKSLIQHETQLCSFRWRRCSHCLQIHNQKYFNGHICEKPKNLGEFTETQVNYKERQIKKTKLLLLFETDEEQEDLLEYFIPKFMENLNGIFMFEDNINYGQRTSKLLSFYNCFIANNIIEALNNKTIHPSIVTMIIRFDDSVIQKQPIQLDKQALFDPDIKLEDDKLTVFFSRLPNNSALRAIIDHYGPIKSHKIFGRHKLTKLLCGIIEFQTLEQVDKILRDGKIRYNFNVIYVKKFERR